MNNIIPAIIAKDFDELKEKISLVEGLVNWVQLDIMDGKFVPPITWQNAEELKNLNTKLNIEVHLMIQNPEMSIEGWIKSGAKRILMHYESTSRANMEKMIHDVKAAGLEVGIALKMETEVSEIDDILEEINVVQFMGISEIGYYGHVFDGRVLEKITDLKNKDTNIKIEVDGGINLESAEEVLNAGADNLVSGSAIFNSGNIKETIQKFQNL
jgi:ribulose-phosphate 3-epimerase